MLLTKELQNLGNIRGTIYDFEHEGDVLPMHDHDEVSIHITIVARGKIKAHSSTGWEIEAEAGKIIDFKPREPHEITALEPNTRIVNIRKTPPL